MAEVTTANGRKGSIDQEALKRASATELVSVELEDGQQIWVVADNLVQQSDGRYLLPIAIPRRSGADNGDAQASQSETTIIPVIAETAVVSKRQVEGGGVRISKVVREREETVHTTLTHQETDVQRIPVGEFVSEPEQTRQEGDTLIVPVYEEVLVVEKRLRLRERLLITKRLVETDQDQQVVLRSEEATVERVEAGATQAQAEPSAD